MENEKLKILVVLALVLGVLGGYFFGSTNGFSQGYSAGYSKAQGEIKQRLVDTKIIEPTPKEIRTISGTVKSVGDNSFVLESRMPFDPTLPSSEQGKTVIRTVKVSASTEITIRKIEVSTTKPKAGEVVKPFTVTTSKSDFKSISVGSQIIVEAVDNIANATEFEAKSIFLNGK